MFDEIESSVIVKKGEELLRKYMDGKKNLDKRIVENEQWYKMLHWEQIRDKDNGPRTASAWLFNSLANKHADAMDNYPQPSFLPREEGDKADAEVLSKIVPVILKQNNFEQAYNDAWHDKLKSGTGVYKVFWDKDKDMSIYRMLMTKTVTPISGRGADAWIRSAPAACPAEVKLVMEISTTTGQGIPFATAATANAKDTGKYPRVTGNPYRNPCAKCRRRGTVSSIPGSSFLIASPHPCKMQDASGRGQEARQRPIRRPAHLGTVFSSFRHPDKLP